MKPIIFINPEELLEKGRPAAVVGTRKMQQQKRKKKNAKGETVVEMQWVWMKKGYQKWEYDGMVSPSEKKAYDATHRKKTAGMKKVAATKQKIKEAKEQDEADKKAAGAMSDKPIDSVLAVAPTKVQLYWSDKTTDEQRKLCDQTGILTQDQNSYEYVKKKMGSVFTMTADQKNTVDGLNPFVVLDSDGKAFDDPLFLDDTLANMKAMLTMLLSPAAKYERGQQALIDWAKIPSWERGSWNSVSDYTNDMDEAIERQLMERIEALEKDANDKILLNKIKSWDKGVRGVKNINEMHHILIEGLFGSMDDVYVGQNGWTTVPEKYKELLLAYGINETAWQERGWGREELVAFAMATINDEYRKTMFQPWITMAGNITLETITYKNRYGDDDKVDVLADWPKERLADDTDSLDYMAAQAGKNINKLTLEFTNKAFRFQGVQFSDVNLLAEIDRAKEKRRTVDEYLRQHPNGNIGGNYIYLPDTEAIGNIQNVVSRGVAVVHGVTGAEHAMMGINPDISWREMANEFKALQRRKGFEVTAEHASAAAAIIDAGKALGKNSMSSSANAVESGFRTFYNALSPSQRTWVDTPSTQLLKDITSTDTARIRSDNSYYQRQAVENFFARGLVKKVDLNAKKVGRYEEHDSAGLVQYGNFRKSAKGKWRAGKYSQTREPYGSAGGPKGATKAKYLSLFGTINSNYDQSNRIVGGALDSHVDASLKVMTGINWQLKTLLKDEADVVPEWKVNPKLIPFGSKNDLTHTSGVSAGSGGWSNSDSSGRQQTLGTAMTGEIMKDHYEASVASVLGLSSGVTTMSRTMPKISLKTNTAGNDSWQSKIDESWTHDDPRVGGNNNWRKGSLKVQNVFDIEYHDYYKKYKEIEKTKGNVNYGWHGTSFMAGASIIKGGYARGGGLFGDGQYIAKSSSKSAAYLAGGAGSFTRRPGTEGVLFWNRCAFGNTNDIGSSPTQAIGDRSVDTVYAPGTTGPNPASQYYGQTLKHDEWCVKNRAAVVPLQWVDVVTQ